MDVKTPQLDKISEAREEGSQAIGDFLYWLRETKSVILAEYKEYWNNGKPRYIHTNSGEACPRGGSPFCHCEDCQPNPEYDYIGSGYYPIQQTMEQLLAEYFSVDLKAAENERRALLDALHAANSKEENNG